MNISTIKFARTITGGDISNKNSKMTGSSFGGDPYQCQKGSELAKIQGSVCHQCYAKRGNGTYKNVREGRANNTNKVIEAMRTNQGMYDWINAMVFLLDKRCKTGFHRWHDSGDLQSSRHFESIVQIAKRMQGISFWLPTKEKRFIDAYIGDMPNNLVVRLSGSMIDGKPPKTRFNTSTVHKNKPVHGFVCPAPTNGGKCGTCTACYDSSVSNVSYHKH